MPAKKKSHEGIVCTGETYAKVVKLTFARGAALADPARLFNSSLEGNTRRAVDLREGDRVDERAFRELVRAAVALNASRSRKRYQLPPDALTPSGPRHRRGRSGDG